MFTAWHDFEFPGHLPLVWRRFYQTGNPGSTPLGRGWACLLFTALSEAPGALRLIDEEGSEVPSAGDVRRR